MITLTQIKADFANAVADFPVIFTYNGTDYTGLRTELSAELRESTLGSIDNYKFSIRMTNTMTALPESDEPIIIDGNTYYVVITTTDSLGASALIHLMK